MCVSSQYLMMVRNNPVSTEKLKHLTLGAAWEMTRV